MSDKQNHDREQHGPTSTERDGRTATEGERRPRRRSASLGLAVLMMLSTACLDTEAVAPEETPDLANRENHPFHVAVFDHTPTEAEIQADLARFAMAAQGEPGLASLVGPTGFIVPQRGQKLVRIDAATSNISNAGTDSADRVQFTGVWKADNNQIFSESFVLDNPNANDLNRNSVSVFYYLLNVRQHVSSLTLDRFLEGQIANSSSDAWHCNNISLREQNFVGATRIQSLPFNQWVDYPSSTLSAWIVGNNSAWLTYY